ALLRQPFLFNLVNPFAVSRRRCLARALRPFQNDSRSSPSRERCRLRPTTGLSEAPGAFRMQDVKNRRAAARFPLILPAELVAIDSGPNLLARTSDVSRTGCYIDTLNPISSGSLVRIKLTRGKETFDVTAKIMYVSPGLGMGVRFEDPPASQLSILDRWLAEI